MFTLIIFIAVLSVLVFVHEFGHFWTARKCGLKPEKFAIGMGPRAIGIYKNKEGKRKVVFGNKEIKDASDTIYSFNWLPLGGYVMLGEDEVDVDKEANHFANKSVWQRAAILLAGVTMNVILAIVLFTIGYIIGSPQAIETIEKGAIVSDEKIYITGVLPDSPADKAGIEDGDIVLSIAGQVFESSEDIKNFIQDKDGQQILYKIERDGEIIEKDIVPVIIEETKKGGIGIGIAQVATVKYPIHLAIYYGVKKSFIMLWMILLAFGGLMKSIFTGNGVGDDIGGPILIAEYTGTMARMGYLYLLQFTAMLSLNLAIINALPYPALDGGRVLFLVIEKLKGSPVKREVEGVIHYIGFATLMLLILVVTIKDISRYSGWFKGIWEKIVG